MMWSKCGMQYSFRDSERAFPADYSGAENWYRDFVAWVRVDPAAQPKPPGPPARFPGISPNKRTAACSVS